MTAAAWTPVPVRKASAPKTGYDTGMGQSQASRAEGAVDTVAPSTPAGLTAVADRAGEIALSWTAATDGGGLAGYTIAYGTQNGFVDIDGQTQMISNGALMVTGHIPETGEVLWQVLYGQDSTISRIVHGDGLLFVNCGGAPNRTQLWAIREGGSGDVTNTHVVWKMTDDAPHQSSPVLVDDLLYLMSDRGELICKEPVSGEDVWTERLKNDFGASLLYADGRIYITSKKGMTTVIEPGRTFNKLAENELDGEIWASPAVAGNSLLLRSKTHLYRIRNE